MQTSILIRSSAIVVMLALACTLIPVPKAHATSDWVRILAGAAAGAIVYNALADDHCWPQRHYSDVYRHYDPPPNYARYRPTPREAYNEGYRDGFKDGRRYGYDEGWYDGRRVGFRQGERVGYREGYRDGRRDERKHQRRTGPPAWHPPTRGHRSGYWSY